MKCTSFCTASSYDKGILKESLHINKIDYKELDGVIHMALTEKEDIFIFMYGCVVFWNVTDDNMRRIFEICKTAEQNRLPSPTQDKCNFTYGALTYVHEEEDLIELESADFLIKLSLSHGLSQSVKLEVFEQSILKTIEKTRPLTQQIREIGKTSLSRKKLSQLIGELFQERNLMNLDTDLLDTPEFFWKRPAYEAYYHQAAEYMDIKARLDILNRRLDVVHDVYDFLSNELHQSHSSSLEWIIILLIVTEVILTVSKDILKLF